MAATKNVGQPASIHNPHTRITQNDSPNIAQNQQGVKKDGREEGNKCTDNLQTPEREQKAERECL